MLESYLLLRAIIVRIGGKDTPRSVLLLRARASSRRHRMSSQVL